MQTETWALFKLKHEQTQQPSHPIFWLLSWRAMSLADSARAHAGAYLRYQYKPYK